MIQSDDSEYKLMEYSMLEKGDNSKIITQMTTVNSLNRNRSHESHLSTLELAVLFSKLP